MDFGSPGFSSNPYIDQQVQDSLGDTVKAWNMVQQPAYNAAMVHSGSFGNSGIQQMNDYGLQQLQHSLGRQANDMRSNNYWQGSQFDFNNYWRNLDFDRGVYNDGVQQNQQQFQNGLNLLGMQNQANQQNLGFGTTIQNTPLNYYGQFSNMANGMGQGYATTNSSMTAQGSPLMGAMAGWQLGNAWANAGKNSLGNPIYNAQTDSGGWGGHSTPLGSFYYGNGTSGD